MADDEDEIVRIQCAEQFVDLFFSFFRDLCGPLLRVETSARENDRRAVPGELTDPVPKFHGRIDPAAAAQLQVIRRVCIFILFHPPEEHRSERSPRQQLAEGMILSPKSPP